MSDENNPGPNRTVFRPSPLQGMTGGQPAQPTSPQQSYQPPPPGGSAPPPLAAVRDDVPAPSVAASPRNPMMVEATGFLALVASVRAGRARISLPDLHRKASAAISQWEQAVRARQIDEQMVMRGRYALCATIDDVALNLPGQEADAAVWAQRNMVVQFFHENYGGDRFWELLKDMIKRPAEFQDVLELYHACMAAGFEGRYRVESDGKANHQAMMQSAYAALNHPKALDKAQLSPHWRGEAAPPRKIGFWAPLLFAAGAAAFVLVLVYIMLRLVLMGAGAPTVASLQAINPDQPLRLSRVAPPPPAPPEGRQMMRLRTFLAPEIQQGLVQVLQDATTVRVRTTVGQLFQSGSDQLDGGRASLFARIGQAIETEPGPVRVEGYTDTVKIHSIAFPDNMALSQARAQTVAGLVKARLTDGSRVSAQGYADASPIASNDTADGKSRNRRVEIVIQRRD